MARRESETIFGTFPIGDAERRQPNMETCHIVDRIRSNWLNPQIQTAILLEARAENEGWVCPKDITTKLLEELEKKLISLKPSLKPSKVRDSKSKILAKLIEERDSMLNTEIELYTAAQIPSPANEACAGCNLRDPETSPTPSSLCTSSTAASTTEDLLAIMRMIAKGQELSQRRDKEELLKRIEKLEQREEHFMSEIQRLREEKKGSSSVQTRFNMNMMKARDNERTARYGLEEHLCGMIKDQSIPTEKLLPMEDEDLPPIVPVFESACQPRPELMTGSREDLVTMREVYIARF